MANEVEIVIKASNQASSAFQGATRDADSLGKSTTGVGSSIAKLATGTIVAGVAIHAVGTAFKTMYTQALDAEKANAQTAAAIKSTGGAAGKSAEQIESMSRSLAEKIGVDHNAIQSNANLLLTFTNIKGVIYDQALPAVEDMATAMHEDGATAAVQLGKALNDPITGITALHRIGVTFSAQQKEQIANFVKLGDVASAQGVILQEVTKEFGGSAEAAATPMEKLKVKMDDIAETLGTALLPAVNAFASALDRVPGPILVIGTTLAGLALVLPKLAAAKEAIEALGLISTRSAVGVTALGAAETATATETVGLGTAAESSSVLLGGLVTPAGLVVAALVGLGIIAVKTGQNLHTMQTSMHDSVDWAHRFADAQDQAAKQAAATAPVVDKLSNSYDSLPVSVRTSILANAEGAKAAFFDIDKKYSELPKKVQTKITADNLVAKQQTAAIKSLYAQIPRSISSTFSANTKAALQNIQTLQAYVNALHGKSISVDVYQSLHGSLGPLQYSHGASGGIPGMAAGGISGSMGMGFAGLGAGRKTLVGEQGPELVNLPFGSSVTPAGRTASALAGGGGGSNDITIYLQLDDAGLLKANRRIVKSNGGNVQVVYGRSK